MTARLSVGLVSPFAPTRSGIADYSSELLPALRERLDVTAYPPERARGALRAGHDVLLFQIGNDPCHAPSVEALADPERKTPAVVVLHDFVLHHLFAAAYLDAGRFEEYARELVRAEGERGWALAQRMRSGPRTPVWDLRPWSYPMSAGIVRDAAAVVVHSRLVRGAVLRQNPGAYVAEIPHHAVPAPRSDRNEARRALGLPVDRPVAATLGVVTPAKRVEKILEALATLPGERRPFLFVGGAAGKDDRLHRLVRQLDLAQDVRFGGYLSEEDFWRAASAATLAVNLRHPTMGETSGAVCRLAGFGLPLIVSDTGWFRELPDEFASKIPIGGQEVVLIAKEMSRIAFDPTEAENRSRAAREWGKERAPQNVAALYAGVLQDVADGWAGPLGLAGLISARLVELGVGRVGALSPKRQIIQPVN